MTRPRGQLGLAVGVVIVILALALIGLFAVCTPGENDHSMGRTLVAYHDGGECWDEYDCGGDSRDRYDQNYGSRDDRNRNQRRNRGAFSPGPFDRSPITIIVCPPGTQYCGSDGGRSDQPPDEERTHV